LIGINDFQGLAMAEAVNSGRVKPEYRLKVGDKVLFTTWAGDEYKDRKTTVEFLVMHEGDVLAVIE
jgi:chaperonin GroES